MPGFIHFGCLEGDRNQHIQLFKVLFCKLSAKCKHPMASLASAEGLHLNVRI